MRAKRLSKQELDELATQIVQRRVYLAHVSREPEFQHAFGWLFAMMDAPLSESQMSTIGACYADMSAALPRAINGIPMFTSMRSLHRDDVMPLHWKIMRKQRVLDSVPLLRRAMLRAMGR